jgi:hypothetical protein
VVCSGMISRGFGLVALFAIAKTRLRRLIKDKR